jgi:hypothetical protein
LGGDRRDDRAGLVLAVGRRAVVADVAGGRHDRVAVRGERLEVVELRAECAGVIDAQPRK